MEEHEKHWMSSESAETDFRRFRRWSVVGSWGRRVEVFHLGRRLLNIKQHLRGLCMVGGLDLALDILCTATIRRGLRMSAWIWA